MLYADYLRRDASGSAWGCFARPLTEQASTKAPAWNEDLCCSIFFIQIAFGETPQEARGDALGGLPTDHASINAFAWTKDQDGGYYIMQIAFGETPQEA